MGTRLKRDIGRATASQHTRLTQGFSFGMWPATILCPALTGNRSSGVDDHAPDGRVRPHAPKTTLRQPQGQTHVSLVSV
jgi:hypothetical protein